MYPQPLKKIFIFPDLAFYLNKYVLKGIPIRIF